jgi:hypothetical protein
MFCDKERLGLGGINLDTGLWAASSDTDGGRGMLAILGNAVWKASLTGNGKLARFQCAAALQEGRRELRCEVSD